MNDQPPYSHPTITDDDERDALRRLRAGDLIGLDPLVLRYQVAVTRTAYLITRDRASAEDAVQTVFIRLAERIHQLDPRRPFAPYLFRSVTNEAIKSAIKRERTQSIDEERGDSEITLADLLPDWSDDPALVVEQNEVRRAVWHAMGELPPKQRAAAVMRYVLNWSEAEIASALAIPAGTVKWRLHDARQRLQKLLAPFASAVIASVLRGW